MKKILLIFTTAVLLSSLLKAQDDRKMHFGLKASPSLAWIKTDSKGISGNGTKFGFGYGLMTEFTFSTNYAFATGVDVNYRGGNLKQAIAINDSTTATKERNITLQYIEVPITLKLKTNEIGSYTYFLQFGVAPGINIRAKSDNKITTQIGSNPASSFDDNDVDIKDDINNINLSMIISGGMEYTLSGSTTLLTSITFNNGFLDVFDSSDIKGNSNLLSLTVGILF